MLSITFTHLQHFLLAFVLFDASYPAGWEIRPFAWSDKPTQPIVLIKREGLLTRP